MKLISDEPAGRRYTISQLSKVSGISPASIKFYLREGLLAPGDLRAAQKAYYDEQHLRRLVLIRALRELAGLSIDQMRKLIEALEQGGRTTFELVASAIDALAAPRKPRESVAYRKLHEGIRAKLRERGLEVRRDSAALDTLAQALLGLRKFQPSFELDELDAYLDHVVPLAEAEFAANEGRIRVGTESTLLGAVAGTVLFEPMILAIRRLAHEHFAKQVWENR